MNLAHVLVNDMHMAFRLFDIPAGPHGATVVCGGSSMENAGHRSSVFRAMVGAFLSCRSVVRCEASLPVSMDLVSFVSRDYETSRC